jgi:hypothetical protein
LVPTPGREKGCAITADSLLMRLISTVSLTSHTGGAWQGQSDQI